MSRIARRPRHDESVARPRLRHDAVAPRHRSSETAARRPRREESIEPRHRVGVSGAGQGDDRATRRARTHGAPIRRHTSPAADAVQTVVIVLMCAAGAARLFGVWALPVGLLVGALISGSVWLQQQQLGD